MGVCVRVLPLSVDLLHLRTWHTIHTPVININHKKILKDALHKINVM